MTTTMFSYGWLNPAVAVIMSTSGCLLAIVLSTKARGRPGRGRARLLAYATIALGGVGVFQAQLVAQLGFGAAGGTLRYDLVWVLAGFGAIVVAAGAALSLIGFGQPGTARVVAATTLLGLGTTAEHYLAVSAMRGLGFLYYEPGRFIGSTAIGTVACGAVVWSILSPRGMRSAILAAVTAGAGVCAMHYLAAWAVQTDPGPIVAAAGSVPVTGQPPMMLMAPAVLLGAAATAMLWFFTVGKSTVDDLRAIFEDPANSVEIEPWMINEVTRRVSLGYKEPLAGLPANDQPGAAFPAGFVQVLAARPGGTPGYATARPAPVVAGPREARMTSPASLYRSATHQVTAPMPGWGGSAVPAAGQPAPNDGEPRLPAVPDRYPPGYSRSRHNPAASTVSPPPTA